MQRCRTAFILLCQLWQPADTIAGAGACRKCKVSCQHEITFDHMLLADQYFLCLA